MNRAKPGGIDYLYHAEALLNRPGYTHNIVTGCLHWKTGVCRIDCYARRMVERGFLKGSPSYPYGFEPTFHPERVRAIGGDPKLFLMNNMGDGGGAWNWRTWKAPDSGSVGGCTSKYVAEAMREFARLNPEHVILLLTKNPAAYGLVSEWPTNVYPGFTATNNEEYERLLYVIRQAGAQRFGKPCVNLSRMWFSLEPWLDERAPQIETSEAWHVIGGLTGPGGRIVQPVSDATMDWLERPFDGRRFVKENADWPGTQVRRLREYPEEWKVSDE